MAGIDEYTKLMLHCNGDDESQVFTDSELTPKTVTTEGNAQLDTAIKKFGSASGMFDGNGDYLTLADHADWDFDGDFTVDFWIYRSSSEAVLDYLIGNCDIQNGSDGWLVALQNNGAFRFSAMYSGGWGIDMQNSITIDAETWTHLAVVRFGSTITMYKNGVSIGTVSYGDSITASANIMHIGKSPNDTNWDFGGWLDEIRVSKGIARWTEDFTPPTEEYSGAVVPPTPTTNYLKFYRRMRFPGSITGI